MTKKIVFASHDPGGCNLLIPIIDFLAGRPGCEISLLVAGSAKAKMSQSNIDEVEVIDIDTIPFENFPNEVDVKQSDVSTHLAAIKPDVIITSTSINSNIERYAIQYGKASGISTLSYIDSWTGEDIRFNSQQVCTLPDFILVCDEQMKTPYLKFEKFGSKVLNFGNPHLQKLANGNQPLDDSKIEVGRVLFFCENLKHYFPEESFNEFFVLQSILNSYTAGPNLTITIRPHPLESISPWEDFVEISNGKNDLISLQLDRTSNLRESIEKSILTFGISSMALIEASMMGKHTFSYQAGIQGNRKFLYIPFDEYGIKCAHSISLVCDQLQQAGSLKKTQKITLKSIAIDQIVDLISQLTPFNKV